MNDTQRAAALIEKLELHGVQFAPADDGFAMRGLRGIDKDTEKEITELADAMATVLKEREQSFEQKVFAPYPRTLQ